MNTEAPMVYPATIYFVALKEDGHITNLIDGPVLSYVKACQWVSDYNTVTKRECVVVASKISVQEVV
jgi:hypothetical protein